MFWRVTGEVGGMAVGFGVMSGERVVVGICCMTCIIVKPNVNIKNTKTSWYSNQFMFNHVLM